MANKKKVKHQTQYEVKEHPVAYVNVINNSHVYVTRESDGIQYGQHECTDRSYDVSGLEIANKEHYDIAVPFKIVEGETYYLLWANYDTGDSFSRHTGHVDWIDLYENKETAEENAQRCLKVTDFSVLLSLDDKREYTRYVPWNGYFEHLNFIEVLPLTVGKKRSRYTR